LGSEVVFSSVWGRDVSIFKATCDFIWSRDVAIGLLLWLMILSCCDVEHKTLGAV